MVVSFQTKAKSNVYALCSNSNKIPWGYQRIGKPYRVGRHHRFSVNDSITMQLDLSKMTLSYATNQGVMYIEFDDIVAGENIIYSMAVCCTFKGDKVELISYKTFT